MATPSIAVDQPVRRALRRSRVDLGGSGFRALLIGALVLSLATLVVLILEMLSEGFSVLTSRFWQFVTAGFATDPAEAGIWQGLQGTLFLLVIVAVVSFPLGIGAAVYLEEYASAESRFARVVNVNIRNLAGVPSIVYGLLGFAIFVGALAGVTGGSTVISGGLTLAALVLPIVIIAAQEALRSVPSTIREAALALGATKWETIRHHVLPSALPGMLTGTVLSLSRAAGEAAPLLVVGAVTSVFFTGNQGLIEQVFRGRFTALPMVIFSWTRQRGPEWAALVGASAFLLLVIVVAVNAVAIWLRNRYEQKW